MEVCCYLESKYYTGPCKRCFDPIGSRRRLYGDMVHVPQPAENRFSWEEEKISGLEEGSL